jgi:subtilisin family serine protease
MSRNSKRCIFGLILVTIVAVAIIGGRFATRSLAAPQAVIIELNSDPVVVAKAKAEANKQTFDAVTYRNQILNEQNSLLSQLSSAGIQYSVVAVNAPNGLNGETSNIQFRYNYVFNGITLAVDPSAIETIRSLSTVKSVHNDEPITMQLDQAVEYVRAPSLYGNPPQVHMGDSLNSGGVEGQGINIAVIDTGIDWTHPMFGGDPTPPRFGAAPAVAAVSTNQKVIYYMNLTAGAVQDDFGHGTHVAAITAGYLGLAPGPDGLPLTGDDLAIHGVAPQAKLMGYKVLTTVGSGVSSSIIMAIEDAVQPFTLAGSPKPVAQVINLSLGNTTNDPNYPTSVACDNATLAGTTVVVAAGNSGAPTPTNPTGEGTIGSPGTGRRVLTVGATLDPGSAPNRLDEIGGRPDMKAFPLDGGAAITSDITANYVYCGVAETPDQVPDSVNGKIALIVRGGTVNTPAASPVSAGTGLFSNKAAFAVAKGAIAVVIYNNVAGELTSATVRKSTVPVVGLSQANGEYLKAAIGSTATGAISAHQISLRKALLFDPAMGDFSSKGPVAGYGQIKPDVGAPGVSILSATVRAGGAETNTATMFDPTGYISASGTSMATPMTAGVVALIKQRNPGWTPSMIRAALMNTGTNLRRADGTPISDGSVTLNQQGAGLIDAYAAAGAKALMGVGAINQTAGSAPTTRPNNLCPNYGGSPSPLCGTSPGDPDFLASWSFATVPIAGVIGTATKTQTVTISDIRNGAGAGVYQLTSSAVRNLPDGVSVSFTDAGGAPVNQVTVPANGSANFNVTISINGEAVPNNPTQIEWYVTAARSDGGQTLRMPFQLRAIAPTVSMSAPSQNNVGNTEFSGNPATDIDGNYQLSFAATGANPAKLRLEESNDNGATWAVLADVSGAQTTFDISNRGNGNFQYRVRGLYAVENGLMPGPASAAKTLIVDRRIQADATSMIEAKIVDGSLSLAGGVWQFDQVLRNTSSTASVFAPLQFSITGVSSSSGTVSVKNADNGGNGVSSPATFDYTPQVGADQQLSPGEATASRRIQFNDPASEMFTITVVVKGYFPDPAGASSGGGAAGATSSGSSTGSSSGTSSGSSFTLPAVKVMQITVNPLTKTVTTKLL